MSRLNNHSSGIVSPTHGASFEYWLFRVCSGLGSQVQAAALEVDRVKIALIAESACRGEVLFPCLADQLAVQQASRIFPGADARCVRDNH